MTDDLSRRGFLGNMSAASLAALFAGKITSVGVPGNLTLEPEFDYRCIRWGMSQDEVVAAEGAEAHLRVPAVVMYNHSLDQLPLTLTYQFALQGDDAVCVAAVRQTDLIRNSFYIDFNAACTPESRLEDAKCDYTRIKQVLKVEYGRPDVQDAHYQDEELVRSLLSRIEDKQHGQLAHGPPGIAEKIGKLHTLSHNEATIKSLMLHTTWNTSRTSVSLLLMPVVFGGVMLMVRHDSIELAHLLPGHPDFRPT